MVFNLKEFREGLNSSLMNKGNLRKVATIATYFSLQDGLDICITDIELFKYNLTIIKKYFIM